MSEGEHPRDFRDFFWAPCSDDDEWSSWLCFQPWDVAVSPQVTKVLYLHGALHLYELPDGRAAKRLSEGENLLDAFYRVSEEDLAIPLFVAEGHHQDKLRVIGDSPYLSFAYERLVDHRDALVIFGHSLAPNDQHISDAVGGARREEPLAIAVQPHGDAYVRAEKARYMKQFPAARIAFFDATTHPLGSLALRLPNA
jgi:hypothetical protein